MSGAQRGYLKCSIRGTNDQLLNIFYKFLHLELFNIKHKIVHLQVARRQIFFSENHVFRKQKRKDVYGLMGARPQFWILNSAGKMMTCQLRDTNKFLRHRTLSVRYFFKVQTILAKLKTLLFFPIFQLSFCNQLGRVQKVVELCYLLFLDPQQVVPSWFYSAISVRLEVTH